MEEEATYWSEALEESSRLSYLAEPSKVVSGDARAAVFKKAVKL